MNSLNRQKIEEQIRKLKRNNQILQNAFDERGKTIDKDEIEIDRLERAYDYLWKAFDVARVAPNITPKLQEHITKILQNADVIRNGEE